MLYGPVWDDEGNQIGFVKDGALIVDEGLKVAEVLATGSAHAWSIPTAASSARMREARVARASPLRLILLCPSA